MSERVRKLAKQAGFSLDQNGIYTAKLEHLPITENMEKFAELLIQECAGLVDHVRMEDGTTRGDFIRKHFGVEP